jgi:Tfp pilus assembly protein PilX
MKPLLRNDRRALLVLSVLACLTLVMLLAAAWLRILVLERQQLRAQQNRMQAEYLAQSALSRAAARLAANPKYDGETFRASAESLGAGSPAAVTIRVEAGDDPQDRLVTASAQVPADGRDRAQRSIQQKIPLLTKEKAL